MNHINMIRKSLTFEVSDGIGYFFGIKNMFLFCISTFYEK